MSSERSAVSRVQKWFRETEKRKGGGTNALTFWNQLKMILIFWNMSLSVTRSGTIRKPNARVRNDTFQALQDHEIKNVQVKEILSLSQTVNRHFHREVLERQQTSKGIGCCITTTSRTMSSGSSDYLFPRSTFSSFRDWKHVSRGVGLGSCITFKGPKKLNSWRLFQYPSFITAMRSGWTVSCPPNISNYTTSKE